MKEKQCKNIGKLFPSYPSAFTGIRTKREFIFSPLTSTPAGIRTKTRAPIFALHRRTFWYKRKTQSSFSVLYQCTFYIEQNRAFRRTGKNPRFVTARSHTPSFENSVIPSVFCFPLFLLSLFHFHAWFYFLVYLLLDTDMAQFYKTWRRLLMLF